MSEQIVVAGDAARMRKCADFLCQKFESDGYQIVSFESTNLTLERMLIQMRKKDVIGGPPRTCAALNLAVVSGGIRVKTYDSAWYDVEDGSFDCFVNEFGKDKLKDRLYSEAMMFFSK